MTRVVALTGATGFIGSNLINALVADGWSVQALSRKPAGIKNNIKWIYGSLDDNQALQDLVNNAEAVIHCAGRVRGKTFTEFKQTNAGGTENIIRVAADQNPLPKFLHISSLAAREPQLSWYANSKFISEQAVKEISGKMSWTIFRPTAVYGPGDRELSPLFRSAKLGILPAAGFKQGRFSILHVDDLVSAVLAWLNNNLDSGNTYELADGKNSGYGYDELASTAMQVWQHRVFILPIPVQLIYVFAILNLALSRVLPYSPMLTPGKVRELTFQDWTCDCSPFTRVSGWQPEVLLKDAMATAILPRR